jgi:hypothetical protein
MSERGSRVRLGGNHMGPDHHRRLAARPRAHPVGATHLRNWRQPARGEGGRRDRVNLLRNGRIEYDKPVAESSVEELTDLVVSEYRKARETGNGG